ncbi:MAG: hypothetical protein JNM68_01885 [Dinghuibacter sp.]|nr:hypothetical protein [Dinghuibacter sp.]
MVLLFVCPLLTACSTGQKTGKHKVNTIQTIQLPDTSISEWQAEKDFLLSDYVPGYCYGKVLNTNSLACLAAFGGTTSHLWRFTGNNFIQNGIKIPYARISDITMANKWWQVIVHEQESCKIVRADDSFAIRKEIPFLRTAIIGPTFFAGNNGSELVWTESQSGTSIFNSRILENEIGNPAKVYETAGDIYELVTETQGSNQHDVIAFTEGDELTAYVLQPGLPVKPMWNKAYGLRLFTLDNEHYLSSAINDINSQISALVIGKVSGSPATVPDTVVRFGGGTSIFSLCAIPWKKDRVLFSIVTKNPVSFNNIGEVSQLILAYDTRTKTIIGSGKITPPGLLQHIGYIENEKLVLLFAREKIYLSVFDLNSLVP